jgi:LisH
MRSKLLSKLKGNKITADSLDSRVLASIILDYLNKKSFKYSLSVFIPECGDESKFLSPTELSEYFKIDVPAGTSTLESILSNYFSSMSKPNSKDSASQTLEQSHVEDLEHKLRQLEISHLNKKSEENTSLEEKILKVQRDCENRMKIELQGHVTRIRETEIVSMKLEEANKYQHLLQKYKENHEKNYNRELEALKTREKKIMDQLKSKELEIEHKNYQQRQEYLKDIELAQERYNEARKKTEIESGEYKLQKKLWETKVQEYEDKLKQLDLVEKQLKITAYEEFLKYKLENESKLEEEKLKLLAEKTEIQEIKKNWNLDSDRIKNSEDKLEVYVYQVKKLTKQNEKLKNSNQTLEENIEQLRTELKILSDSQNRIINELSIRENEIKVTKAECESLQLFLQETKEKINRMKAEHQSEIEKYKKQAHENAPEHLVSDYLIERKLYWNKLDREQDDIKKGIMEVIKPQTLYSLKPSAKQDPNPSVQAVTVKTHFEKALINMNSSEESF